MKIKILDDFETLSRSRWIAFGAFLKDELRYEKFVARGLASPPISSHLLTRCDKRVRVNASRDVADNRCFNVDRSHGGIVSRRTWL